VLRIAFNNILARQISYVKIFLFSMHRFGTMYSFFAEGSG
jgi:hypothetical protein